MKKFGDIVKTVRKKSGLTQDSFAKELGVSSIYISKIETDQKDVSKQFVIRLAEYVGVHPSALAPFLFLNPDVDESKLSDIEKKLIALGESLQIKLISKKFREENN